MEPKDKPPEREARDKDAHAEDGHAEERHAENGQEEETERATVVGIGASAGGIEALQLFFEEMPEETGMVFVVVMHLAPDRESSLASVLQNRTGLPVTQVTERTRMEPDHVYVIPPDQKLEITDGHLAVSDFEQPRGRRAPIDFFFRTLAEVHPDGIGVVLSGTGTDGTVGFKAIKEQGGLLLAQDPEEAEYDGMPRSAIATGLVDFVLPVGALARKLVELKEDIHLIQVPPSPEELPEEGVAALHKILTQLRTRTGHDFGGYKRSTMLRRLQRRMRVNGVEDLQTYLGFLRGYEAEAEALFKDLLISVTNFFRDPAAWDALDQKVLPRLFEEKTAEDEVRAWVPGCATGEEAYSIAMLLLEHAERRGGPRPHVQVFASDLDEDALARARSGRYPEAIAADVPEERLRRFFTEEGEYYRVKQEVRDVVLFATHSLLKDPPFSRLDLVSCRNVLIYLRGDLQEKVFDLFHYALRPGGYLFLGGSENATGAQSLFRPVEKEHRLYQSRRSNDGRERLPELPLAAVDGRYRARPARRVEARRDGGVPAGEALHRRALEAYAPPSVLIDEHHNIMHLSPTAGRYLQYAGGAPTHNLLKSARPALRLELRAALGEVFGTGRPVSAGPVEVEIEGERRAVHLLVRPAGTEAAPAAEEEEEAEAQGRLALVVFAEADPSAMPRRLTDGTPAEEDAADARVEQLQSELERTRERLQVTIEEHETSEEEIKATNEELQSINEEYKSTLEELETSREELQSINEELVTVNQELKNKVDELSRANDDLKNLMNSAEVATVFLDRRLRLKRYTPPAEHIFNVVESDRGRPLAHITHRLSGYDALADDAQRVLDTLVPLEREVESEGGEHYLLRLLPYRTTEDRIAGVVLTFVDVTRLKEAQRQARRSEERYRLLVENVSEYAIFTLSQEGRITTWNAGARRLFGYDEEEIIGRPGALIFTAEDRAAGAAEAEMQTAARDGQAADERWHVRRDGTRFWGSGVMTALYGDGEGSGESGAPRGFAKVLRDNTQRRKAAEALRQSEEESRALVRASAQMVWTTDAQGRIVEDSPTWRAYTGQSVEAWKNEWSAAVHPEDRARAVENWRSSVESVTPVDTAYRLWHARSGSWRWNAVRAVPLRNAEGAVRGWVGMNADIDDRKRAEEALRELNDRLEERVAERTAALGEKTEQVRRLASELVVAEQRERHRIAQVLHDDLQQQLYGIQLKVSKLGRAALSEAGAVREEDVEAVRGYLDQAIGMARNLTVDLSPPVLQGEGLPETLAWLATQMEDLHDLHVEVEAEEDLRPGTEEMRVLLFQVVRELLFNVVKHADVGRATVALRREDSNLVIRVADGGHGFDAEAAEKAARENGSGGFGLRDVRERIGLFGGALAIDSVPGDGTRITVTVPIEWDDVEQSDVERDDAPAP